MAELTPKERLLPSLLDRLTDDAPGQRQETRDARIGTMQDLRQAVLRDLEWLMNTTNLESVQDLSEYPELASTVINFGMPGLSGYTTHSVQVQDLEKLIKRAVQDFEPRILKNTVRVKVITDGETESPNAVAFQIEGTLWGQPVPEALYLHTELDLELGDVKVTEA